jgi:apolipoprotein N-acyltransferase
MMAAFLLGTLAALAMAPLHCWPLLLIGLGGAFVLFESLEKAWKIALIGWVFSFGYFLISLNWIGNALLVEGNDYKWAWPLAVSGLPALLAFFSAVTLYIAARLKKTDATLRNFALFCLALYAAEWLRGHLFTGFPWNLFGYGWGAQLEMLQIAHIGTIYLLSALTIFWGAAIGFALLPAASKRQKLALLLAALVTISAVYAYGAHRLNHAQLETLDELSVKIIQPNIPQEEKWDRRKAQDHFEMLLEMSKPDGTESAITLIVWPETATHFVFLENEFAQALIRDTLGLYERDVYLISGALLHDPENDTYTNSIAMLDRNARMVAQYDKVRLVPFGEYIPFQRWIPLETVTRFDGFVAGESLQTITITEKFSFSPLVCYEILFPRKVVEKSSGSNSRANAIINVTNDAWYGISAGPYQHFLKAKLRAIEEGVSVIRSANTGISGYIDPYGRIVSKTTLNEQATVHKKVIVKL